MKYCIFDNDKTSLDFKMIYISKRMKPIPNIKIDKLDIGSRDGVIPMRVKIGENDFSVTFECFGSNEEVYDNIRDLINYLNPVNGTKNITFSDEPKKTRSAMLSSGSDIDYFYAQALAFGKFDLEFIMVDPFTYESKKSKYYYAGKSSAVANLINEGGHECPLVMKVYAPKGIVTTKHEESYANINYVGTWANYTTQYLSGGASKYANGTGSYAELTFYGTAISIHGVKSAGKGKSNVYIDGVLDKVVDGYAPSEEWQAELYSKSGLSNGNHTVRIEVSGTKNDLAVGYQLNLDFFKVTASSIPSDVERLEVDSFSYTTVPTTSNIRIKINNDYITYTGTLTPTDELIIDTEKYTMELNGYNCLDEWKDDFPKLKQGVNKISVEDSGKLGSLVIFEFSERWL